MSKIRINIGFLCVFAICVIVTPFWSKIAVKRLIIVLIAALIAALIVALVVALVVVLVVAIKHLVVSITGQKKCSIHWPNMCRLLRWMPEVL